MVWARVSGFPEIPRFSFVHALNIRACGRRLAAELGKRFDDNPWRPRLYLHGGLTDEPDEDGDGFRLNAIQSDRVADPETYSTGLVSAFVGVDLRNLAFYGIGLNSQPRPRQPLLLRLRAAQGLQALGHARVERWRCLQQVALQQGR